MDRLFPMIYGLLSIPMIYGRTEDRYIRQYSILIYPVKMSYILDIEDIVNIINNIDCRLTSIEKRLGKKCDEQDLELVSANCYVIDAGNDDISVSGESQLSIFSIPFRITAKPGKVSKYWDDDCEYKYVHFWTDKSIGIYPEPLLKCIPGFVELIIWSNLQISIDNSLSQSQYDIYILNVPTVAIPKHNRTIIIFKKQSGMISSINPMNFPSSMEDYIKDIQLIIGTNGKIMLRINVENTPNVPSDPFCAGNPLFIRYRTR